METVALLLIVLSNQGYWFGGQTGRVEIQWVVKEPLPDAVFRWELMSGPVRVAGDKLAIRSGDHPSILTIQTPEVRVRTRMTLVYRLERQSDGQTLTSGKSVINLFPNDIFKELPSRLMKEKIAVLDKTGNLAAFLRKANISFKMISRLSELELSRSDLVLVAEYEIEKTSFSSNVLVDLADRGTGVLVFRQTRCEKLMGYPVNRRDIPRRFEWRADHPLLTRLEPEDLASWFRGNRDAQWAIGLPTDEAALEIVWWPRVSPGTEPVPIDALLVSRRVGKGQVVLCQIPLGNWQSDPRSQLFLAGAMDYLLLRPEPTPRPSDRVKAKKNTDKSRESLSIIGEKK
jgi:hypothetical protein